jgi:acyl carrier protein
METVEKVGDDFAEHVQARITSELRRLLEVEEVDANRDFFELGGDSLKATELLFVIEESFGIVLDPVEVFERPRIADFIAYVVSLCASARQA